MEYKVITVFNGRLTEKDYKNFKEANEEFDFSIMDLMKYKIMAKELKNKFVGSVKLMKQNEIIYKGEAI